MRAEETLQRIADFCGDMYPTRKHALNQLFCVIGNGYEWQDGELVDVDDSLLRNRYTLITPIKKAVFRQEEFWNSLAENHKEVCRITGRRPNPRYYFSWYPLSRKYSYLFDYPEDIKDDWKALIDECRQMLIEDGVDLENVED